MGILVPLLVGDGIVAADSSEFFTRCIVEFHRHDEGIVAFINELREASQRHHGRTELAPGGLTPTPSPFRGEGGLISTKENIINSWSIQTPLPLGGAGGGCQIGVGCQLLTPEHVEGTDEGGALSAVVVQAEELETSIVAGAQVALYLVFIGKVLQLTAGMEEPLGLRGHAVVAQQVAEDFEVARLIGAALILSDFLEVREGTPLPLLVGDDRSGVWQRVAIVARKAYLVEVVVVAVRSMHVPVEAACPTLHMVLRPAIPSPAAANAGSAIDLRGVVLMHCLHPVVAIAHPVASRLIASRHHHKRRMMAIGIDDAAGLLEEVFVDDLTATQLHAMIGPRRSLGLQVEAHLVGSGEGGFGRAIAVEAHVVESVLATLLEDAQPRRLVGGRIARFGEAAVLHRATQPDGFAVQVELRSADADVAHAEAQRERLAVVAHLSRV